MMINSIYRYNKNTSLCAWCGLLFFALATSFVYGQRYVASAVDSEKENGLFLYERAMKQGDDTRETHEKYLDLLLEMYRYTQAEQYIRKRRAADFKSLALQFDMIRVLALANKADKAQRVTSDFVKQNFRSDYAIRALLNYMSRHSLPDYALSAIDQCRRLRLEPSLYAMEMVLLHQAQSNWANKDLIGEYLNLLSTAEPSTANRIKDILQGRIDVEQIPLLRKELQSRMQRHPESAVLLDIMIWTYIQEKDFSNALAQAQAYDRQFDSTFPKMLEVSQVAFSNNDLRTAAEGFSYAMHRYVGTEYGMQAEMGYVNALQHSLSQQAPEDSLRLLVECYRALESRYPSWSMVQEMCLEKARLYAYRLNEKDSAVAQVNDLLHNRSISMSLRGEAKMELAKLYMLKKEPWESILLYNQVAHDQKDSPPGYEAKFRLAKLYYYQGYFELARGYLDILKEATSRQIANNAMDLNLRIKDNTKVDTTGSLLRQYARAELLLEENNTAAALETLDSLKATCKDGQAMQSLRCTPLRDDICWLEAKIRMSESAWNQAHDLLKEISDRVDPGPLADDALLLQGEIMERLNRKPEAGQRYLELITRFADSLYLAEARRRYRALGLEESVK